MAHRRSYLTLPDTRGVDPDFVLVLFDQLRRRDPFGSRHLLIVYRSVDWAKVRLDVVGI
jgi:hypothetical protein